MNAVNSNPTHTSRNLLRSQRSPTYSASPADSNARRIATLAVAPHLAPTAQRVLTTTASAWTAPLVLQTRRTEIA